MTVSIRRALGESLTDFYVNAWRLAFANLAWGLCLLVLAAVAAQAPAAVLLGGVLAVPLAGIHRLAARVVRGEPPTFADMVGWIRQRWLQALGIGIGVTVVTVVLVTNMVGGFQSGGPLGWFIGMSAVYGLAGLAIYLVALWPVLVDPAHEAASLRRKLALAGVVVIGRPMRAIGLAIVVVGVLAVSTVLFAAIVLVSVAYTSLVAARVILPTLDELEARVPEGRLPG